MLIYAKIQMFIGLMDLLISVTLIVFLLIGDNLLLQVLININVRTHRHDYRLGVLKARDIILSGLHLTTI